MSFQQNEKESNFRLTLVSQQKTELSLATERLIRETFYSQANTVAVAMLADRMHHQIKVTTLTRCF